MQENNRVRKLVSEAETTINRKLSNLDALAPKFEFTGEKII
jgi:hypothetical protein